MKKEDLVQENKKLSSMVEQQNGYIHELKNMNLKLNQFVLDSKVEKMNEQLLQTVIKLLKKGDKKCLRKTK